MSSSIGDRTMSDERQRAYDESIVIEMSHTSGTDNDDFNDPEPAQPKACNQGWKLPTFLQISLALDPWWQTILVTSSVIAVVFDPLFFYIPYTSEVNKCMGSDKQVQTAALVFRSVTDIPLLVNIIYQLHVAITFALSRVTEDETLVLDFDRLVSREQIIQFAKAFSSKLLCRSFLTDLLSILPLPQLLMVGLFFDIGGNNYLLKREILSGFLLMQYVPRIYRIYLSSGITTTSALWFKVAYNFFLYLLASHVLGSVWYFFSVQREITCWYQNCIDTKRSESECTFYCHSNITTTTLITPEFNKTLTDQCILKVPSNMTDPPFDFGMFSDAFKNDIQGKINIPRKIGYCLWWGLRNFSAFGTSLETSSYLWETIFAMFISITGLLLFSCLIGNNIQSYMEMRQARAEKIRQKLEIKKNDIENWMKTHGLKEDMREEIRKNIKKKLEKDINADMDDIFSMLPKYNSNVVKHFIGIRMLKDVPVLRFVDVSVLKTICDYLQPVMYQENKMVFHQGKPFNRMVFITHGTMTTYTSSTKSSQSGEEATRGVLNTTASMEANRPTASMEAHYLKKGDSYGDKLLQLASSSLPELPISLFNVKCNTKVEAFVLRAQDLQKIVNTCGILWLSSLDFNAAASEDKGAVPEGQFQQQQINLKRRVASSTVGPTCYNGDAN